LLTKQGDYCWFHARAEVLDRDAHGYALRMAGSLQCITERKQAEAHLRLSEERLRRALTESEVGIWDWDLQSDRLYWSPDVEVLFGLTPGSFPGTYAAYIGLIYALDRGSVLMQIEHSLHDQATLNIRHRVVWTDHSIHWLAWTGRIHRNADGVATRVLGIVHAIKGHSDT
jgi:PAS domain S-box-containing protein